MARRIPAFPPLSPRGQAPPPRGQAMAGMTVAIVNTSLEIPFILLILSLFLFLDRGIKTSGLSVALGDEGAQFRR